MTLSKYNHSISIREMNINPNLYTTSTEVKTNAMHFSFTFSVLSICPYPHLDQPIFCLNNAFSPIYTKLPIMLYR